MLKVNFESFLKKKLLLKNTISAATANIYRVRRDKCPLFEII